MCKGTSKSSIHQEKMLFSLPEMVSDRKIRVDFDSPDISSNGGIVLIGNMQNSLAWKIGQLIPDSRKKEFIHHTYMEMVSQRIGQILCGYEDANDCNQLRSDSVLKMSVGRKPSDSDLSSQSTEDNVQYVLAMKQKCGIIVTNNYKDYRLLLNVRAVRPERVRAIPHCCSHRCRRKWLTGWTLYGKYQGCC